MSGDAFKFTVVAIEELKEVARTTKFTPTPTEPELAEVPTYHYLPLDE